MKTKLLFSSDIELDAEHPTGIMKKVLAEAKAMSESFDVYLWGHCQSQIVSYYDGQSAYVASFTSKSDRRKKYYAKLREFIESENIYMFYHRYAISEPILLNFLKNIKRRGVHTVLEIPTYPYDGEFTSTLRLRLINVCDRIHRGRLIKYVDRIALTTGKPTFVFGIPCVNMTNGVDFDSVPLSMPKQKEDICLIAVASMRIHHGFDRVIKGMADYYKESITTKAVRLFLVGNGPYLDEYKRLAKKLNVTDYIKFCGEKNGSDLDAVFNEAIVGIGALGCHRIGVLASSPLKNREYTARGLPIVYSSDDELIDGKFYAMKCPPTDEPIDIKDVVRFVENVYNQENVNSLIRNDSYEFSSMNHTMKPVITYFEEISKGEGK
jgi:glycosyltransferase involved in cell wall biosynthesis